MTSQESRSKAPALRVRNLTRSYTSARGFWLKAGEVQEALRDISFEVARGELFGLVGPNGAGKTTLVKILTTLLIPSSGSAEVLGHDVVHDTDNVRRLVGLVLGGERGFYTRLTARENLWYFAVLYQIPRGEIMPRIMEVLELVGLSDAADRRVEEFSRGMKQRLHLARGLLHKPEVLLLDEPTIGLDPRSSMEIRRLIRKLCDTGVTVFMTTHYMFEAEELCDRVAVIVRGKFEAMDSVSGLKRLAGGNLTLEIETPGLADAEVTALSGITGLKKVNQESLGPIDRLTFRVEDATVTSTAVSKVLDGKAGVVVRERPTTLEDVYLQLVAKT